MASESIFRPILVASQLEEAAAETLSKWMPTYLREIERQLGRTLGEIPAPRSYSTRNEFTRFPEDQLPFAVVISPGLADEPLAEGDGSYNAWWSLGVGIVASARDEIVTNFLAKVYGAAARAIMLQNQTLGGIAHGVEWAGETYDDVPVPDQERTIRASMLVFRVYMVDVVTRGGGPAKPIEPDPATMPGDTWPTADTVTVQVVPVGLDEEVNP